MGFNRKVNDISEIFDKQWEVNHNYQEKKEFLDNRKNHFNRMNNIVDKEDRKKEILEANSVNGRVNRLEQNMKAARGNDLFRNHRNLGR